MEKLKKIIIPVFAVIILGILFVCIVFFLRKEKEKDNYYVSEYDVSEMNPCISKQYSDNKAIYLSSDSDTNELLLKQFNNFFFSRRTSDVSKSSQSHL